MADRRSRSAQAWAEVIRSWHERYGVARRPEWMNDETFAGYRATIEHFRDLDLSAVAAQTEIARAQQSGNLEWSYGGAIPRELWSDAIERFDLPIEAPPRHLGELAGRILDALRDLERSSVEPHMEETSSSPDIDGDRLRFSATTRGELEAKASAFYEAVVAEQHASEGVVGGLNLLISCSLERYPWHGEANTPVVLIAPELLGLRITAKGSRPDDLIDAVRDGDVDVVFATGGPTGHPG
jgi:hypothetical protein